MATIRKEPNGRKTILVVCPDRKRRSIRLGKMHIRTAEKVKHHIESLASAATAGHAIERDTADWLRSIGDELHDRISRTGLCHARERAPLGVWIDRYIAALKITKHTTSRNWRQTRANLVDYFGEAKQLRDITPHDAVEWRAWLSTEGNRRDTGDKRKKTTARKGVSDNTVRRRTGRAKQLFNAAIDAGLAEQNPFDKLPSVTHGNEKRQFYVPVEWIQKCIDHAPCDDWKLILALCRFGGLRCPSELLRLQWTDVNLPDGRMTIHADKTEHHAGGGVRQCPIFPELRPYLEAAWDRAPDGSVHVINRYRSAEQNLRTTFEKIIKRAGLTPWPKLFQNLRASRETELMATYPAKDVAAWMGNSVPVAMKHYAMPRAETFERAIREGVPVEAAQNAAQQTAASVSRDRQGAPDSQRKSRESGENLVLSVPPRGIEPAAESLENNVVSRAGGTQSGTDEAEKILSTVFGCDRLREIVETWPELPADHRDAIVASMRQMLAEAG